MSQTVLPPPLDSSSSEVNAVGVEHLSSLLGPLRLVLESLVSSRDSPSSRNGRGGQSITTWSDAGTIYLEADLSAATDLDLDLCIQDGHIFLRIG